MRFPELEDVNMNIPILIFEWSLVLGEECLCVGCHYLIEGEDSGTRGTVIFTD